MRGPRVADRPRIGRAPFVGAHLVVDDPRPRLQRVLAHGRIPSRQHLGDTRGPEAGRVLGGPPGPRGTPPSRASSERSASGCANAAAPGPRRSAGPRWQQSLRPQSYHPLTSSAGACSDSATSPIRTCGSVCRSCEIVWPKTSESDSTSTIVTLRDSVISLTSSTRSAQLREQ